MEVIFILETKAYKLTNEEKFPVVKDCLGREDVKLIKDSQMKRKKNARLQKDYFPC